MPDHFTDFLIAVESLRSCLNAPGSAGDACAGRARRCGEAGARAGLAMAEVQRVLGVVSYPFSEDWLATEAAMLAAAREAFDATNAP